MASRLELHEELCEVLESRNVYFQAPESVKMSYNAISYSLGGYDIVHANDGIYRTVDQYDGVVITVDPDTTIPKKMMNRFKMCSFGRPYTADNLHHYPFTLYY